MKIYMNGLVLYKTVRDSEDHLEAISPKLLKHLQWGNVSLNSLDGDEAVERKIAIKEVLVFIHKVPYHSGRTIKSVNDSLNETITMWHDSDRTAGMGSLIDRLGWVDKLIKYFNSDYESHIMLKAVENMVLDSGMLRSDLCKYFEHKHSRTWTGIMSFVDKGNIKSWLLNDVKSCDLGNVYENEYKGLMWEDRGDLYISGDRHIDSCVSYWNSIDLWKCNHCLASFDTHSHDSYEVDGDVWCEACWSDDAVNCHSCDYSINVEYAHYHDDEYMCSSCIENAEQSIRDYTDNPEIRFYEFNREKNEILRTADQKKIPYYGVELEVEENDGNKYAVAEDISHYGGGNFLWCKADSSLENGFEICSHPMTFEAWENFDIYRSVLKYRGEVISFNTTTCGIHIHMNRSAFSDLHVLKFMTFIHEYKKLTHFISQRKRMSEYNQYSQFQEGSVRRVQNQMFHNIKGKKEDIKQGKNIMSYCTLTTGQKYVPVNLGHRDTIEIRVFKGNLREVSFRKNIEFLDALYYWTKITPLTQLDIKKFGEYTMDNRKKYPNLIKYIDERMDGWKSTMQYSKEIPDGLTI